MKTELDPPLTLRDILLYVLAYLLWLVSIAVCMAAVIQLRSTVNVLWVVLGGDRYSLGLANQVSLLLGGFAAFVYVVFLESYYRRSVTRQVPPAGSDASPPAPPPSQSRISWWLTDPGLGILLRRFALTISIPLGLLVVFLIMNEVAWRIMR